MSEQNPGRRSGRTRIGPTEGGQPSFFSFYKMTEREKNFICTHDERLFLLLFFLLYLHYVVEKNKNPKKKNYLQTKTASSTEWGRSNVTSSVRNKKEIKIGDIYMCNKSEEINGFWRSARRFIPARGGGRFISRLFMAAANPDSSERERRRPPQGRPTAPGGLWAGKRKQDAGRRRPNRAERRRLYSPYQIY